MNTESSGYRFHSVTISLCPECVTPIPAKIIIRRGSVYLRKACGRHGTFECLMEEDAEWYLRRMLYDKPGTIGKTETVVNEGCPMDCGLCPDHEQHTCIGLLEITNHCDLSCPLCYAESGGNDYFLELKQIERMMDFFQDAENGGAEILQISGGEPCTHPGIINIIEMARLKGFKYVMLNTNGLRIAEDIDFVEQLSLFETGFEVYLQFDGFDKDIYMYLRGKDLNKKKLEAVENLVRFGVAVTLVPTIEKGINDDAIGEIIDYGMNTPCIRGINFQPLAYFGRGVQSCPLDRITITGILRRIEKQTSGRVGVQDFVPLPCNVDSVAVAYFFREKDTFVPISRHIDIPSYLSVINNTFYLETMKLTDEIKKCKMCDCKALLKGLQRFIPANYVIKSLKEQKAFLDRNTFRISVSMFQDPYNFEMHAMKKECIHVITGDLKRIPFSAYNMLHRRNREYRQG